MGILFSLTTVKFILLGSDELLRLDNVPKARALTIMGNRLIYGNYTDVIILQMKTIKK